jgi:heme/copper-type cytochrome/quinol oxidase subunit 2
MLTLFRILLALQLIGSSSVTVEVRASDCRVVTDPKGGSHLRGGFQPEQIEVVQGQTVTVVLRSQAGTHTLVVPELGIRSQPAWPGHPARFNFVASQTGCFEFYCDQPDRDLKTRMTGELRVVAR